jgi:RES domain-containing protein
MLTAHKSFPDFFQALSDPKWWMPWEGDVLRQSAPPWQSKPYRFTGIGSVLSGGRWNVQRLMPAVYASTRPDTLNAEAYSKGRRYGWSRADFKAQLIVGMHWRLQAMIDLTSPTTLKALGVNRADILTCDWDAVQRAGSEPVTQAIARAAFENFAEGLVVPSARHHGGVNIVYYPTHRRDGTLIQTLDEVNIPFRHGL